MGIVITNNTSNIQIDLGNPQGDIKMFPKGSTRIELINNKVEITDISNERGEPVTLDSSNVTTPSSSNNTVLHATLIAYLDAGLSLDFHTEVAMGNITGYETWNKFGYNDDIDVGTELIASWGGAFQYLTSGETIDIVSTSANDTVLGSHCQKIIVYGVDENWESQIEIIEMDGTNTITTTTQWIGINRVAIFKANATNKQNEGTITITANSSSYTMAQMPVGQGTTQQCIFYVPSGYQFNAEWLYFNIIKPTGQTPKVDLLGYVYSDASTAEYEIYRDSLDTSDGNHIDVRPPVPFVVSEKSILWFEATTDKADTNVRCRFSGELGLKQ